MVKYFALELNLNGTKDVGKFFFFETTHHSAVQSKVTQRGYRTAWSSIQ